jgi:hypothetical protein
MKKNTSKEPVAENELDHDAVQYGDLLSKIAEQPNKIFCDSELDDYR